MNQLRQQRSPHRRVLQGRPQAQKAGSPPDAAANSHRARHQYLEIHAGDQGVGDRRAESVADNLPNLSLLHIGTVFHHTDNSGVTERGALAIASKLNSLTSLAISKQRETQTTTRSETSPSRRSATFPSSTSSTSVSGGVTQETPRSPSEHSRRSAGSADC